jgi:hypothetical protein
LVWSGEPGGYVREGRDTSGRFYAQVQSQSGRYGIYFVALGVWPSRRLWRNGFTTDEKAAAVTSPATSTLLASDGPAVRGQPISAGRG